jgi:hypothetical protein
VPTSIADKEYGGDFYAAIPWLVDYLSANLAQPQTSPNGAWVRGVYSAWDDNVLQHIATASPIVLVTPGAATVPSPDNQTKDLALRVPVQVSLLVATQLFRAHTNGHALWVSSPIVTKLICLLYRWRPVPQPTSTPSSERYQVPPRAFGELTLRSVVPGLLPDKDGKPLPGAAVTELNFDYAWRWCAESDELLLPRCHC